MIRKIMKYANGYKRYTLFATIMVFIAVLCSIIPYFFVYQIINPLITGTGISIEAAASRIVLILVFLTLNFALYKGFVFHTPFSNERRMRFYPKGEIIG